VASTTVDELFGADGDAWSVRLAGIDPAEVFPDLVETITRKFVHVRAAVAGKTIVDAIPALLRLDVGRLLAGAWKKCAELQKYGDPKAYPPDETVLVELAEHTIRSSHRPHVDVMVGESRVQRIDFDLELTLAIKGAVLTVRDGKIRAVSVGSCKGGGELSYKGCSILKRASRDVPLPGKFEFEEPVTIPGKSLASSGA
jgi:hypothetical protein